LKSAFGLIFWRGPAGLRGLADRRRGLVDYGRETCMAKLNLTR
jgi:hypothetical protein